MAPPARAEQVPRIAVAGASSGVGKTLVACGVVHALREAGAGEVQAFKVGPDYIDTSYLSEASGRPAANLDTWMMGGAGGAAAEHDRAAEGAGASVIEGVMGYYDGMGDEGAHSTYHVARAVGAPVVLVVNAGGAAHSVAAAALGFARYRRGANIAGVVLNRVGSERHERMCRAALGRARIPVFGAVPRDSALAVESGRLGLVQARRAGGKRAVNRIARRIAGNLNARALLEAARGAAGAGAARGQAAARKGAGKGRARGAGGGGPAAAESTASATICVARDDAFGFYYHNSLENLRRAGAVLRFFSPVSGRRLPECGMVYVGGGFPEEHAAALEANAAMLRAVREFAAGGGPVYAEGGGVAYLAGSLVHEKRSYRMAGVVDCDVAIGGRLRLGYVRARTGAGGGLVARGGAAVNGHAFHHMEARNVGKGAAFAYDVERGPAMAGGRRGGAGRDGMVAGGTFASMMQVCIGPAVARRIVGAAARHARR